MSEEQYQPQLLVPQQAKKLAIILILSISLAYIAINTFSFESFQILLPSTATVFKITLLIIGMILGLLLLHFDEHIFVNRYTDLVPNKIMNDIADDTVPSTNTTNNLYPQLITRSVLFLLLYIPLSIFMYTSSGSPIGIGLMIGLGVGLGAELWSLKNYADAFQLRFLQNLKKQLTDRDRNQAVWIFIIFVAILSLLTLFQV